MAKSAYDLFFEDVQDELGKKHYSGTLNKPFQRAVQPTSVSIPQVRKTGSSRRPPRFLNINRERITSCARSY